MTPYRTPEAVAYASGKMLTAGRTNVLSAMISILAGLLPTTLYLVHAFFILLRIPESDAFTNFSSGFLLRGVVPGIVASVIGASIGAMIPHERWKWLSAASWLGLICCMGFFWVVMQSVREAHWAVGYGWRERSGVPAKIVVFCMIGLFASCFVHHILRRRRAAVVSRAAKETPVHQGG